LVGAQDSQVSPPGTLTIAPDPNGIILGIPIELSQEASTPCGDEGVTGTRVQIGFTTGRSESRVIDYNNMSEAMLIGPEIVGVPFNCATFAQEDGPGTLVLSAANLHTLVGGAPSDIVAQFVLVD
jgi:hypothetical protein